ncbi:inorganic polyphosphate/ATP-NAD kinase [Cenarchaeum symbiosum A]|uniref:NAD kinase n=1 Tax=Cenarchaeum symbiosum (strain A) TaxID=414004 RepID=A0RXC5_CENSY|nr:inorganic polyphosphate/ATP-NAD kinase [Cenarchaeum symbiosum A]
MQDHTKLRLDRVAVVGKFGSRPAEDAARAVAEKFLAGGSTVYTISPISVGGAEEAGTVADLRGKGLDLVVTLGGDGTTLRAFRHLEDETPVLTVNVGGNRGILSEITLDMLDSAITQMREDRVILERRTRVAASAGGEEFPPALNEIFIQRKNLTKTAEIEIRFLDDTVRQKMDGVIIATPSGSTGHSFSLGGPILHESLSVLIITPVAPVYRLASIVVPDEKIEFSCSHDCSVVMDAQVVKSVGFGEPITIKKYARQAVFVRLGRRGLRQMSKLGF